jgi:hypothetical protein
MRLVVSAFLLAVGVPAWAEDGLRCGNQLVSLGDSMATVIDRCGQPTEARRVDRVIRTRYGRARVVLDTWLYDFGPQTFTRTLTFGDGVLRDVEVGGYGR